VDAKMKLHERTFIVKIAKGEIEMAILKIANAHDLTFGEVMSILGNVIQSSATYEIRQERHGDRSKSGDEA
jgi:hypothetical protein